METIKRELDGAPLPDIKACGLCSHIHMGRCKEYAPNAQFSCACPGECPHGGHPAYCSKCNEPEIKACSHLQSGTFTSLPVKEHPTCANCGTHICSDCQDDAVHCHSYGSTCLGIICAECLETARKRDIKRPMFDGKRNAQIPTTDYLCAPCCAKQDTARLDLQTALQSTREWMPIDTAPKEGRLILGFAIVDTSTGNWRMRIMSHNGHAESRREEWNGWGDSWIPPTHWMPLPQAPTAVPVWLDELMEPVQSALERAKEAR
jgi:hypothetical protein